MRLEVVRLIACGKLPSSTSEGAAIQGWQEALEGIATPVSDQEASALAMLFPDDDDECYGLAWSLIHLIESAPNWPLQDCLRDAMNPWIALLATRTQE